MANHGPVYGLSREIQLKNEARFHLEEAQQILSWIQATTGIAMKKSPFAMEEAEIVDALRNGVQLCVMLERITGPGTIRYHIRPTKPFLMMENISMFLTAIRNIGVPEITCFQTVDLYERKHLYKVFETIRWVAALAMKRKANVPLAKFTFRLADRNPRHFSEAVLRISDGIIPRQCGTNKGASQKGMKPYGLPRQIIPEGK